MSALARPARGGLRDWLARAPQVWLTLFGGLAAFSAYFSMYAFRKPFTAAAYDHVPGWDGPVDFKIALVIAQVLGYALSKFIGVKFVSELPPPRRATAILLLIGASWLALILFAIAPPPLKILALFLNGLPLGLIWGLVFGYLEGRRTTEVLAAMLCASFILSSGIVKSVGSWLLGQGVDSFWMPAATGALFLPLLGLSVWALTQLPPPSAAEQAARMARPPICGAERRAFLKRYAPGIAALVLAYMLLTAMRDFRDNFAAELWAGLGFGGVSAVFTESEAPIAAVTLVLLSAIVLIRDNGRALCAVHLIAGGGGLIVLLSTLAHQAGLLGPLAWMILSGLGLYLGYTPFNGILFDRLVAYTRTPGTAGFLIYVADAAGYAASVGLTLAKAADDGTAGWVVFYSRFCILSGAAVIALITLSQLYFRGQRGAAAR